MERADSSAGSSTFRDPTSLLRERQQPNVTAPMPSASALHTAQKRTALLEELKRENAIKMADENDLHCVLGYAEDIGWTCSQAIARRILELLQTGPGFCWNGTQWRTPDDRLVFGQRMEEHLVDNFVGLCQTIVKTAKDINGGAQSKPLWSKAATYQKFKAWETRAAEARDVKDLEEALEAVSLGQARRVVSDPTKEANFPAQSQQEAEQSSSHPGARPVTANPAGKAASLRISSHAAASGSDVSPRIASSPHPTRGKLKPDAVLLHQDNRVFGDPDEDEATNSQEPLLWSDIRWTIEAKRGTASADFDLAFGDALVRALRIKDTWDTAGNVYCAVLGNTELTLVCVNAGEVIQMPHIDAQTDPDLFIRALLLMVSHGSCHDFWAQPTFGATPAFLDLRPGNKITLTPMAGIESFAGSLVWQSHVQEKDWFYKFSEHGFPLRLCGSRTVVLSGHGVLDGKCRWNFVFKLSFMRPQVAAVEGEMVASLQQSKQLSHSMKERLPQLLRYGLCDVDRDDPFTRTFHETHRIPVAALFVPDRFFPLANLKLWQVALVLADVVFSIGVLWRNERVLHNDISIGNVGCCLPPEAMGAQREGLLARARHVVGLLQSDQPFADRLSALEADDASQGQPVGSFCDFGNARRGGTNHDTAIPSADERKEEMGRTKSATYTFWSKGDWERWERAHHGTTRAATRHGPEDEVEGILYVFIALASAAILPSDQTDWCSLSSSDMKSIAAADAPTFAIVRIHSDSPDAC
ncbi:unnamed protein product [Sympodiomycopsis kandeliae]